MQLIMAYVDDVRLIVRLVRGMGNMTRRLLDRTLINLDVTLPAPLAAPKKKPSPSRFCLVDENGLTINNVTKTDDDDDPEKRDALRRRRHAANDGRGERVIYQFRNQLLKSMSQPWQKKQLKSLTLRHCLVPVDVVCSLIRPWCMGLVALDIRTTSDAAHHFIPRIVNVSTTQWPALVRLSVHVTASTALYIRQMQAPLLQRLEVTGYNDRCGSQSARIALDHLFGYGRLPRITSVSFTGAGYDDLYDDEDDAGLINGGDVYLAYSDATSIPASLTRLECSTSLAVNEMALSRVCNITRLALTIPTLLSIAKHHPVLWQKVTFLCVLVDMNEAADSYNDMIAFGEHLRLAHVADEAALTQWRIHNHWMGEDLSHLPADVPLPPTRHHPFPALRQLDVQFSAVGHDRLPRICWVNLLKDAIPVVLGGIPNTLYSAAAPFLCHIDHWHRFANDHNIASTKTNHPIPPPHSVLPWWQQHVGDDNTEGDHYLRLVIVMRAESESLAHLKYCLDACVPRGLLDMRWAQRLEITQKGPSSVHDNVHDISSFVWATEGHHGVERVVSQEAEGAFTMPWMSILRLLSEKRIFSCVQHITLVYVRMTATEMLLLTRLVSPSLQTFRCNSHLQCMPLVGRDGGSGRRTVWPFASVTSSYNNNPLDADVLDGVPGLVETYIRKEGINSSDDITCVLHPQHLIFAAIMMLPCSLKCIQWHVTSEDDAATPSQSTATKYHCQPTDQYVCGTSLFARFSDLCSLKLSGKVRVVNLMPLVARDALAYATYEQASLKKSSCAFETCMPTKLRQFMAVVLVDRPLVPHTEWDYNYDVFKLMNKTLTRLAAWMAYCKTIAYNDYVEWCCDEDDGAQQDYPSVNMSLLVAHTQAHQGRCPSCPHTTSVEVLFGDPTTSAVEDDKVTCGCEEPVSKKWHSQWAKHDITLAIRCHQRISQSAGTTWRLYT